MRTFLSALFLFLILTAQAQNSSELLTEDFNTFVRYLEETHPDPYSAFGGRVEFKRRALEIRNSISESTTAKQFTELLSGFTAKLEDGHTFIHSTEKIETNQTLPLKLKIAADGIFVSGATKEYSSCIGNKLLFVNGLPIDSLLDKSRQLESVENKYGAYWKLCNLLGNSESANLLFGSTTGLEITFLSQKGKNTETVKINYTDTPEWLSNDSKLSLKKENNLLYAQILEKQSKTGYFVWNSMASREMVEEVALGEGGQMYLAMNINTVYKTLRTARPENDDEAIAGIPSLYETFFNLLNTMKSRQSKYLIIDLRENGGGMTPLCRPLLYMLYGDKYLNYDCPAEYNRMISPLLLAKWNVESVEQYNQSNNTRYRLGDFMFGRFFGRTNNQSIEEKRKNLSLIAYYKGIGRQYTENLKGIPVYQPHVVVLCSPKTFSAAYHFMYFLTQTGQTTLVGVPSRQAGNAFMETTDFELPNTKIRGSISNSVQIFFPNDPAKGKILTPDFNMQWSDFAKYGFDENAEILYTLDLIEKGKIRNKN